jgi:endonuclease G
MLTTTERAALEEVLEHHDSRVIEELLRERSIKPRGALKHRSEFPPPGPEVDGPNLETQAQDQNIFERIIADNNLLPAAFLEEGVRRQRAVARMPKVSATNPLGTPWGTGFLVSNSLIMTNNHVIGSVAEAKNILVQFNYQVDPDGVAQSIDTWRLDPDNFFYTNAGLDFTLVRVKGRPPFLTSPSAAVSAVEDEADLVRIAGNGTVTRAATGLVATLFVRFPGSKWGHIQLPGTATYKVGSLLNIVQHPAGRMKEVALQKNEVTHLFAERIHYTTDTEGGSSGSPVFSNQWDLVALHHAAGDWDPVNNKWLDNEGMRIDSIVSHLKTQFGTSNPGLLQELNIA